MAVWPADWSTFIPDAIIAISVGLVVGAVLLYLESTSDARYERRTVARERTRIVDPLLLVLQRKIYEERTEGLTSLSTRVANAANVMASFDVDYWNAVERTDLTSALVKAQAAVHDLRLTAMDLGVALDRWCRLHQKHPRAHAWIEAKLLGAPDQHFVTHYPSRHDRQVLKSDELAALNHSQVKTLARDYRSASRRTDRALEHLRTVLVAEAQALHRSNKRND